MRVDVEGELFQPFFLVRKRTSQVEGNGWNPVIGNISE